MRYEEVEREYRSLKLQFDASTLTEDQFRARLEELMLEDEQGRWWIIGYETGKWYYHDGEQWVRGDPERSAVTVTPVEGGAHAAPPPATVVEAPVTQAETATQVAPESQPSPLAAAAAAAAARETAPVTPAPAASAAGGAVPPQEPPAATAKQSGRKGGLFGIIGLIAVVILVAAIVLVFLQRRDTAAPAATSAPSIALAATTSVPAETETAAAIAVISPTREPTELPPSPTSEPTAAPPTATDAATNTPVPPTATETPSPAPTDTPVPPSPTATLPPPKPTATRLRPTTTLAPTNPNVVVDFENLGTWRIGNQKYGTLTQVSSPTHDGAFAAKLAYNFPAVNDNYVVFEARPARNIAGKPTQLSMWVYGDGSGNYLNLWIQDSQGEVQSFPLGPIEHKGWQQMTTTLDVTGNWPQGRISRAGNDQLDYPIRLFAIVLDGIPDGTASKGEIVLDSLMVGGAGAQ